MGFIDALALAGRAKSAYDQGQRQQTFADAVAQQKAETAAADLAYKQAQTQALLRPPTRNIDPLSPEGLTASSALERLRASLRPDPLAAHAANRDYDIKHPMPTNPNANEAKPAEFEKKAAFMLEGARKASSVLDTYKPHIQSNISKIPGLGNYGITEEDQVAQQAAETLYDAYLRLTTGATIAPEELKNAAKQMMPLPGDKPAALAAKMERRAEILRAMESAATPALNAHAKAQAKAGPLGATGPAPKTTAKPSGSKTVVLGGKTFRLPE